MSDENAEKVLTGQAAAPADTSQVGDSEVGSDAGWSYRRVSPKLGRIWAFNAMLGTMVIIAIPAVLIAVGVISANWALLGIPFLVFTIAELILIPRWVAALGYAERQDDLLIRSGRIFRRVVAVPYGRMQLVEVKAGPVERWLGLATLELHTAASQTNASIHGLPQAEADRLRERLTQRGQANLAGL